VATKKTKKKAAKVQLDAATVLRFESALRNGLVSSGAVMMTENKKTKLVSRGKVKMDPATAARLSEALRRGLVASQSVMMTDNQQLNRMTGKVKGTKAKPRSKKS
jgi:hypothetical protein